MEPVRIGLIGVGGYAAHYLRNILELEKEGVYELASVAIRTRGKYPEQEAKLKGHSAKIRRDFDEMLEKDGNRLEVAAIPTGIDSHRDLTIRAFEAGLNVMLEKPTAATIQDIDAMIAAGERRGRFCAIGVQSQWDTNVTAIKRLIGKGRIGRVREAIVVGNWRRHDSYYERNPWAGAWMLNGRYILDGTVSNPFAHYLFNALFFASPEPGRTAIPASVRAELYRAHDIESEDTSCLEIVCDNGARIYFYATLCAQDSRAPTIEIVGEKGRVFWDFGDVAKVYEGDRVVEEIPKGLFDPRLPMFRNVARLQRGLDEELNCPIAMTRSHVLALNGAFESAVAPVPIPASHVKRSMDKEAGSIATEIAGIEELSARAAAERKLYSDLGVPWAKKTRPFSLEGYTEFKLKPPVA